MNHWCAHLSVMWKAGVIDIGYNNRILSDDATISLWNWLIQARWYFLLDLLLPLHATVWEAVVTLPYTRLSPSMTWAKNKAFGTPTSLRPSCQNLTSQVNLRWRRHCQPQQSRPCGTDSRNIWRDSGGLIWSRSASPYSSSFSRCEIHHGNL